MYAHFAADGATALQMAATWRPEIAVLDINMPIMDGYELAQRLTQDELTQHTLLVAFAALDEPVARSSGIASRFDVYCQKGGCPGVLLTLLRSLAQ
ncbi:response regulator [Paraburkholderia kururiensis]|uniref:response regulator n=2 Tax=Paraburkholderia kururiensis TaxID=984307 RepID=UPI0013869253|nr:response regulator [Paraburkholderia kururiensis]